VGKGRSGVPPVAGNQVEGRSGHDLDLGDQAEMGAAFHGLDVTVALLADFKYTALVTLREESAESIVVVTAAERAADSTKQPWESAKAAIEEAETGDTFTPVLREAWRGPANGTDRLFPSNPIPAFAERLSTGLQAGTQAPLDQTLEELGVQIVLVRNRIGVPLHGERPLEQRRQRQTPIFQGCFRRGRRAFDLTPSLLGKLVEGSEEGFSGLEINRKLPPAKQRLPPQDAFSQEAGIYHIGVDPDGRLLLGEKQSLGEGEQFLQLRLSPLDIG
jgi:hypothetical protein